MEKCSCGWNEDIEYKIEGALYLLEFHPLVFHKLSISAGSDVNTALAALMGELYEPEKASVLDWRVCTAGIAVQIFKGKEAL